jgi:hypothetical protein
MVHLQQKPRTQRKARLPNRGFVWVPAHPKRKLENGELDAAIVLGGCLIGMAILLVICWMF